MTDRLLTPQQENFLSYYTNPKSDTFSNAVQSALKAGYSESFANNITSIMPDWLSESIGDMKRLRRAEKNLEEVQNLDIYNSEGLPDPQLIEKRTKVDFFIAERLGKKKYSTRTELSGVDGKDLPTPILGTYVSTNNNTQENISDENQDTLRSGGDISVQDDINTPMVDTVSTDGQGTDTDISSSRIDTTLETRSDERLQEHNAITPILERL
jgi:hypothetical protein